MIHLLLRRVFIMLFSFLKMKLIISVLFLIMICNNKYIAQSSFDFYGNSWNNNSSFRLNSLESNPANFTSGEDWELSVSYNSNLANKVTNNIYLISLSKRLGSHYLYSRFTPGIKHSFTFDSGTDIIQDTVVLQTKTKIEYTERFGFGYSVAFSKAVTTGFSFRYFSQELTQDTPFAIFSDTLNAITTETETAKKVFWKGDIGLNISPSKYFAFSVHSNNLIVINDNAQFVDDFEIKRKKLAVFGLSIRPVDNINLFGKVETNSSFNTGLNLNWEMLGGTVSVGSSIIHDKYQGPYIAGLIPFINYSNDFLSFTVTGIKYFEERDKVNPLSEFRSEGIHNIINNKYSDDKIWMNLNFTFSFKQEQKVKFIDVEIKKDIFPSLDEYYLNEPFAIGKVVNISDEKVTVKPSSMIKQLNDEVIYSPLVSIQSGDTAEVFFYTNINKINTVISKREISQANFYVTVQKEDPDDAFQKPILINQKNSWDGNVFNLKHFVKKDLDYSGNYAKQIINENRDLLNDVDPLLTNFKTVEVLFNNYVKNLTYVSDPRASYEWVQFPNETLQLKGGDCDDLSVCFSSMLEGVGIQTAFVDYKEQQGIRHVSLLINTKLKPLQALLITNNDRKYFVRTNQEGVDEIWIPLEMTSLTNFKEAWSVGAKKFYEEALETYGLAKGQIEIIDINQN